MNIVSNLINSQTKLCFSEVNGISLIISQFKFNEWMKVEEFQGDETMTQKEIL